MHWEGSESENNVPLFATTELGTAHPSADETMKYKNCSQTLDSFGLDFWVLVVGWGDFKGLFLYSI